MAKRITTVSAMDDLTQGDIDAGKAKLAALAKIAPPVYMSSIKFADTYVDLAGNFRDVDTYDFKDDEENRKLYHSLKSEGFGVRGDQMNFSLQGDGRLKVLNGNRRWVFMDVLNREELKRREETGENIGDPLPFETIFGLVFSGLTIDEETAIMADHTGRKGLNEAELAKSIARYRECYNMTVATLAIRFGKDRNKVNRLLMRHAMPTVYREFLKECRKKEGETYVTVGQKALEPLYSAYLLDQRAGFAYREEGPNFRTAWAKFLANPENEEKKVKSIESKNIVEQATGLAAHFSDSPEIQAVKDVLLWASGNPDINLIKTIERLADLVSKLRGDIDGLLHDNAGLTADLKTAVETIAKHEATIAGHLATITERDKTIVKLAKPVKATATK